MNWLNLKKQNKSSKSLKQFKKNFIKQSSAKFSKFEISVKNYQQWKEI